MTPAVALAATTAFTPIVVPLEEVSPSSGRSMKQVLIEVPEGTNLLKKSN